MKINFQIKALECNEFHHLFNLSEDELFKLQAKKILVDEKPGYPCRISLKDADIGETIIALSHNYHDVNSPYKASGPIFIRNNIKTARLKPNEIPEILLCRFLSVRAYSDEHIMVDAKTHQGKDVRGIIQQLLHDTNTQYLHIHNAIPGCYNCSVGKI